MNSCWNSTGLGGKTLLLTEEFAELLEFANKRKEGLLPAMQIKVTLRVFASDGLQMDVGNTFGTSKATVCQMVHMVSNVVVGALNHFVKFKRNADAERRKWTLFQWQDV